MNLSIITKFCKKKLVPVWENSLRKIYKAEKPFSSAFIQQLRGGCISDVEYMVALPISGDGQTRQAVEPATEPPCGTPMGTLRGWGGWAVLSHPVGGTAWKVQMGLDALQNFIPNRGGCYRGFLRGKKKFLCLKQCVLFSDISLHNVFVFHLNFFWSWCVFFLNCRGTYDEIPLWKHHGQKKG